MKRWITLILAAVTLMCGCALTILAEGNADGIPDAATEIAQIDKYGNIDLSISPKALRELGYEPGDIIQVKIGDTDIEMPIGTHYTDVDFGAPICCFKTSGDGTEKTVLAICSGNLAETASIAEKHTVDSDPGFEWRYLGSYDASVTVLFSMVQKQGYADEYALHQLLNSRTDKREDYPQLTDAEYANFRAVETTGMGKGTLYRSSSPVNPKLNRNREADAALREAQIRTVINLADSENEMEQYEGFDTTYYACCDIIALDMGMDFRTEDYQRKLADGLRFIGAHEGPYLIHCNEGKDRTERILADPTWQPDAEMLEFGRMTRDHAPDKSFPDDYDYEFSYHQAKAFAGMTLAEFTDFVTRFLVREADGFTGMTYADMYYQPMAEVVEYLRDNGFKCYVVSGSDRFIVRTFIEGVMDIPYENCIGSDTALEARDQGDADGIEYVFTGDDTLVRTDRLLVKDLKTNKVLQIAQEIGRQPVLSFGNSSGDVSMNNYALLNNRYKSAAFQLIADDDVRDYGNPEKGAEMREKWEGMGYNVISMRDDWRTIYGEDVQKTGEFHWLSDYADERTENTGSQDNDADEAIHTAETATVEADLTHRPLPEAPVVGIAWRADTDSEFFTNICRAVEEAGGTWVLLDQVCSADLAYDDVGKLTEGVTALGSLDGDAAKYVRLNTWRGSNAAEAVGDVSIVLFTGDEDISSTLFFEPEPWHGIVAEIDYNAERDVSDYLTMSYCLDNDIPVMGFCRGMQMLGVISGAEMIQDIPAWFAELGVEYDYTHRNQKAAPEAYRDYAAHDVEVAEGSLLYDIAGTATLAGCPSWHHQAIGNVDNTRLAVTGTTDTNGVTMIEAVERTDKTFAVGLQFHPEAALVKQLDGAENRADYMDYDTALAFFRAIVEALPALSEAA